jgi:hypothetical protein
MWYMHVHPHLDTTIKGVLESFKYEHRLSKQEFFTKDNAPSTIRQSTIVTEQ